MVGMQCVIVVYPNHTNLLIVTGGFCVLAIMYLYGCMADGVARTLENYAICTSKGDYWNKQWFSLIAPLFKNS